MVTSASPHATTRTVALDENTINRMITKTSNNVIQGVIRQSSDQFPSAEMTTIEEVVEFYGDNLIIIPPTASGTNEPVEDPF